MPLRISWRKISGIKRTNSNGNIVSESGLNETLLFCNLLAMSVVRVHVLECATVMLIASLEESSDSAEEPIQSEFRQFEALAARLVKLAADHPSENNRTVLDTYAAFVCRDCEQHSDFQL